MKSGFGLIGALSVVFTIVGCGASDADTSDQGSNSDGKDSVAEARKSVARQDLGDSSFKPAELESTVDKLVKAIEAEPAESMKLKVVLKTLTGYWEPVQLGAKRALGELEVKGGVDAPVDGTTGDEQTASQVAMMQDDIKSGYDGFGLAPMEDVITDQINAAEKGGAPVITIDSDLPDSKRTLYIGTMNADAGKTGGESLVEQLGGEGKGSVVIYGNDDPAWVDGYERTMGAKKAIEAAGYTGIVIKVNWDDGGEEKDMQVLTDAFNSADPPVVGMIGVFSVAFRCAMLAEQVGKKAGDLKIAAFDFDPKTVEYMQSGYIQVTHAQRQYYMGYLAPYVLYGINVLGADKTKSLLKANMVDDVRFNAGLDIVPAAKLDDYYSYLDSLGIGGIQ
ncbi:MAG TPA: substrate-binding domain-containing protein [Polyangiaceae bacterium]|jgi:ribose transport system substrate-binding protein|nr:substrate-binding domain-containing protein [Polyangiaceae bacterium]